MVQLIAVSGVAELLVLPSEDLVLITLDLAVSIGRIHSHLFIVLLQGGQVLSGLRKLTFFHALTNVPVTKTVKVNGKQEGS